MIEYGELSFKVVRLEPGGQEVIARAGNYEICKAAFDRALFIYPTQHLELRQGGRDLQVEGGLNVHDIGHVWGRLTKETTP
jgi:hypothetical protein